MELGRREPRMALAGKPLIDQAAMVEGLLAGGWAQGALMSIVSAPLPEKITKSVAAIISARLSKVPPYPPVREIKGTAGSVPSPRPAAHECQGREGLCGRHVSKADGLCTACRD
ncbi:hypothetical protein [Kitasatospora sp. NPDC091207]|uniref:hypothetical protein n=1 Tax=Kitasatospora sp. NPDC091207 TaxID=3364083 RepID=UPI00382E8D1B